MKLEKLCFYLHLSLKSGYVISGGFVALVVGGNDFGVCVELYSPEGKCQHSLSEIPTGSTFLHSPTLAFIDEKIYACAGQSDGNGTVIFFFNSR